MLKESVAFGVEEPRLEFVSWVLVHGPAQHHGQWKLLQPKLLSVLYIPGQNWQGLDVKRERNYIKTETVGELMHRDFSYSHRHTSCFLFIWIHELPQPKCHAPLNFISLNYGIDMLDLSKKNPTKIRQLIRQCWNKRHVNHCKWHCYYLNYWARK